MAKGRQIALMRAGSPGEMVPMGTIKEVIGALARFNIAPDGSPPGMGTARLFGPGLVLELPTGAGEAMQALVTMNEETMAWAVLSRVCRELKWKMVDLETGRSFG